MGSNLSQQTAERLYNQIVAEGRLSPGDKLPNEVDLSHELGVSRATLREAIRALTVQGVLEVQRGRGTFVSRQVAEIEDFGFGRLEEIGADCGTCSSCGLSLSPRPPVWPASGPRSRSWLKF